MSERSEGDERSEQSGAVLTPLFLFVPDQSALAVIRHLPAIFFFHLSPVPPSSVICHNLISACILRDSKLLYLVTFFFIFHTLFYMRLFPSFAPTLPTPALFPHYHSPSVLQPTLAVSLDCIRVQNREKHRKNNHPIILFSRSKGVSKVIERANK